MAPPTHTTTTRPSTLKLAGVGILAALLTAALFFSPVGSASAQDTPEQETTAPAGDTDDDGDREPGDRDPADRNRGDREELTDEERDARQADREVRREEMMQQFADELGVTVEDIQAAGLAVLDTQLEQRVADGDITQERADEIRERAEDRGGLSLLGGGGRGHRGR